MERIIPISPYIRKEKKEIFSIKKKE